MVGRTPNGDPSASQQARDAGDRLSQSAQETGQQLKQQASKVASGIQSRLDSYVEQSRTQLADSVGSLAAAVQESGRKLHEQDQNQIAPVLDTAAARLESLAQYMQQATFRDMTQDIADLARRRPEVFLGGALFAGFVAARLFKSSGEAYEREQQALDYATATTAVEDEESFGGVAPSSEDFPDIEGTGGGVPGSSHMPDIAPAMATGPTAATPDIEGPDTITPMGTTPSPDVIRSQDESGNASGMGAEGTKDKNKSGNGKRSDQNRA